MRFETNSLYLSQLKPEIWKDKTGVNDFFVLAAASHQSKITVQSTDYMLRITDKLPNFANYTSRNSCTPPAIHHLCLSSIIRLDVCTKSPTLLICTASTIIYLIFLLLPCFKCHGLFSVLCWLEASLCFWGDLLDDEGGSEVHENVLSLCMFVINTRGGWSAYSENSEKSASV